MELTRWELAIAVEVLRDIYFTIDEVIIFYPAEADRDWETNS